MKNFLLILILNASCVFSCKQAQKEKGFAYGSLKDESGSCETGIHSSDRMETVCSILLDPAQNNNCLQEKREELHKKYCTCGYERKNWENGCK